MSDGGDAESDREGREREGRAGGLKKRELSIRAWRNGFTTLDL